MRVLRNRLYSCRQGRSRTAAAQAAMVRVHSWIASCAPSMDSASQQPCLCLTASVSWVVPAWHLAARHGDHSWGLLAASEILFNSLKGFSGTALVKGLFFLPQKDFSCPGGLADSHLTTTESKQRHLNCSISLVQDTQSHSLVTPAGSAQSCHWYLQTGGTKARR